MNEQQKQNFNIRTTSEAAELLRKLAQLDKRDYGDEFEIIIKAEWERRQAQSRPTEPSKRK